MDVFDREIIKQVQQGEREKYLEIFDRYYARVERYARSQLRHTETARDIASETFLRAYRHVDKFRMEENITYLGYLLMICRRLIMTERSRQRAAPIHQAIDAEEVENIADDSAMPLSHLLNGERIAMLQDALSQLPADDREIIHLAFERDLSRQDIMYVMDKPSVSAVTSHLYRAMQKLKAIVAQQGYFVA